MAESVGGWWLVGGWWVFSGCTVIPQKHGNLDHMQIYIHSGYPYNFYIHFRGHTEIPHGCNVGVIWV